ncbi:tRNA dihydrouridine synthase DusB [Alkalicella caledoniensis]|uniref:tRNA-dihydrouridine synthase n=1 Tax=Alkalicella caledoniensis TaxID=2731377 RepID=A0A7G9W825_ALKCA|nr:tRNA dihydrouridine synthase DusB [Alkalicella caledoniensis]QNO14837.1 tRNA dihydrouridine synthase DusB [Alkalicella caledoniensis]
MNLKEILKQNPLVLAPMAGVTDKTFRGIVKDHNCGLLYTEMISTKGLIYGSDRTEDMIDIDMSQHPISVQLFGNDPSEFEKVVEFTQKKGADFIDINMGCPALKIVKNWEGAALMKDFKKAESIMRAVVRNSSIPVTVKIRKGWDEENIVATEFAQMAEATGVQGIAIHGRTREQFYSGKADWDIIKLIKSTIKIPVIGNGDLFEPEDVKEMLDYTKCDGVMIGRGAMGNPWLFSRSYNLLKFKEIIEPPTGRERIKAAIDHLYAHVEYKGEYQGIRQMRKHIAWYLKGLPNAANIRDLINTLETVAEINKTLTQYSENI